MGRMRILSHSTSVKEQSPEVNTGLQAATQWMSLDGSAPAHECTVRASANAVHHTMQHVVHNSPYRGDRGILIGNLVLHV